MICVFHFKSFYQIKSKLILVSIHFHDRFFNKIINSEQQFKIIRIIYQIEHQRLTKVLIPKNAIKM